VRLDEVVRRFGDAVTLEWRAFLLRPEAKERDRDKFVDYTRSWQRPAEMEAGASFTTPWASDAPAPRGSIPAHVAAKTMAGLAPAAAEPFHHRLLGAYFTENRDISDWQVLADLAGEVGVDPREFLTIADEQQASLVEVILGEHNEAVSQGITAVPTVVIDDVLPVPGAQDVATFEHWINRIIDRRLGGS
jgi:predicted DsbA family dithiol-disulfide isomerase